MDVTEYKFKVGDKVVTTHGVTGRIIDICDCENCKERGFLEPLWQEDSNFWSDNITDHDARSGFKRFYRIGNYRFNDFDKEFITHEATRLVRKLKEVIDCLNTIEEEERNQYERDQNRGSGTE